MPPEQAGPAGQSREILQESVRRLLICAVLLASTIVAAPRGQEPRTVAGEWTVTLEFPELNIKDTLVLTFRPGVGLDPNGRLRRGYMAVRERPELGPNRSITYFLRLVDRRVRMSIDRDDLCEVVFESDDAFSGRCSMVGIAGALTARRNPIASRE
jgi:hypothetical protein